MALVIPQYSVYVGTLAGLIVLIPGLTVTTAMTELSTGHLVSGPRGDRGPDSLPHHRIGVAMGIRWYGFCSASIQARVRSPSGMDRLAPLAPLAHGAVSGILTRAGFLPPAQASRHRLAARAGAELGASSARHHRRREQLPRPAPTGGDPRPRTPLPCQAQTDSAASLVARPGSGTDGDGVRHGPIAGTGRWTQPGNVAADPRPDDPAR
jgi:hypothetical protein